MRETASTLLAPLNALSRVKADSCIKDVEAKGPRRSTFGCLVYFNAKTRARGFRKRREEAADFSRKNDFSHFADDANDVDGIVGGNVARRRPGLKR